MPNNTTALKALVQPKSWSFYYHNPHDLLWNMKAKRLEFKDGEPVGHRTVGKARSERRAR